MKRRNSITIGLFLIAVLVLAASYWAYRHRQEPIHIATVQEIRANVLRLRGGQGYKDGGPMLAQWERSGAVPPDPDSAQMDPYPEFAMRICLLTDFVAALTPQQIEAMGKSHSLPYTSLDGNQKKLVARLYKYAPIPEDIRERDFPHSAFVIVKEPGYMYLSWTATKSDGRKLDHNYMLCEQTDEFKTYQASVEEWRRVHHER